MTITPKKITKCSETNLEIAYFEYNNDIQYIKENKLEQTKSFKEFFNNKHFYMINNNEIIIKVESTDYPEIERRLF